ncbi:MAG: hypothetical protein EBZ77_15625, partial [Chitinophagia bacterium]|nr:hypothetical protein [Chitinophagia bacterium]
QQSGSAQVLVWLRPAMAAILVAVISIGGYITYMTTEQADSNELISRVEPTAIGDYLNRTYGVSAGALQNDKLAQLKVEERDIEDYLNNTGWE